MRPARSVTGLISNPSSSCFRQQQQTCTHLHRRPRQVVPLVTAAPAATRGFHSTPSHQKPRKPKHQSIGYDQLKELTEQRASQYKAYTEEEKADLRKRYNPAQMAAIEAGEAAISVQDLATQAKLRRDPLQFQYLDDFSRIEPTIDKKVSKIRGEGQDYENVTDFAEPPSVAELFGDIDRAVEASEERGDWEVNKEVEIDDESGRINLSGDRSMVFKKDDAAVLRKMLMNDPEYDAALQKAGKEAAERTENEKPAVQRDAVKAALDATQAQFIRRRLAEAKTAEPTPYNRFSDPLEAEIDKILSLDFPDVAPDIPKLQDPSVRWGPSEEELPDLGIEEDSVAAYTRVAKVMGQSLEQLRKYRVKTLVSRRVVNQTRLGKIASQYYLCVAGNERGLLGIGEGKAAESDEALLMARLNAIRNMVPIMRYENRTIYGEVTGKSGAVEVQINARQPGYGVRCSEKIFEIARCAGLQDLQAKVTRKARNPMNVAKAVWQALRSQKDPEEVARGRGKKLVDVRKVYYSGLV